MAIYRLGDRIPDIDPEAYVHPQAVVIGDVTIGRGVDHLAGGPSCGATTAPSPSGPAHRSRTGPSSTPAPGSRPWSATDA